MKSIIILTYILFINTLLYSNTINIDNNTNNLSILKYTKIYIDNKNKIFEKIRKQKFIKNDYDKLNCSYTDDKIWLKFDIKNNDSKNISKYLVIKNQFIDNIFLYEKKKNNTYSLIKSGILNDNNYDKKLLNFYFDINFKKHEKKEFYIKLSSQTSPIFFELKVMSRDMYYNEEIEHQLVLAFIFGSLFILIIYNFFIYLFTKDKAYLYYSLMFLFTTLNHLSYTDMNRYVMSEEYYKIDINNSIYYMNFISIFLVLFFKEFFNLKEFKKINIFLNFIIIIAISLLISKILNFNLLEETSTFVYFTIVIATSIAIYFYFKKGSNILYLAIGWSVLLFGTTNFILLVQAMPNLIDEYEYLYEFSLLFEAVVFSVALSNKLNKTSQLQEQVNTNTILTKELHHRVKNNMQFIISMYRLKLAKYITTNKDISKSLNEIELSIQAMSQTHELLYAQSILSNINTKEYISELVNKIKNSFNNTNITINENINTNIDVSSSIYVGLILNELITNSFKYAFPNGIGQIDIDLNKVNNDYILIIKDNGIGFDINKPRESFGLEIINILVKDKLNGECELKTDKGVIFIIKFK